jgi:Uma2 family endonuclease
MRAYVDAHDLGRVGHEKLMVSLTRNDYEPDVCFWQKHKALAFRPQQMRFPAPDFIAEVLSDSTEHIDRGVKFEDYAAHGVTEYWIISPETQTVEQYLLDGETYHLAIKAADGTLKSTAIAGFVIPVRAIFDLAESQRILPQLLS